MTDEEQVALAVDRIMTSGRFDDLIGASITIVDLPEGEIATQNGDTVMISRLAATSLTPADLDFVIEHELMHLRASRNTRLWRQQRLI